MADIFISYSRTDKPFAARVAEALEREGFSVWWDSVLRAGETYDEVTERNLRESSAVVVLWSKESVKSKWVRAEATVGTRASSLVPAMIEECDRPIMFELVQTADLSHWTGDTADKHWKVFVEDIRTAVGRGKVGTSAKPAAPTAAAPAADATIEAAFWNSIADGGDKAEFEAYLNRYPDGHFVDLARNRIAAIDRAAAQKKSAAAARPASPKPAAPSPAPQRPAAKPAAARPAPKPAAKPAPQPAAKQDAPKSGAPIAAIAGVGLLLAAGAAAFFLMRGGAPDGASVTEAAAPAPQAGETVVAENPQPADETPDAEPVSEPAEDGLAALGEIVEDAGAEAEGAVDELAAALGDTAEDAAETADSAVEGAVDAAADAVAAIAPVTVETVGPFVDCDVCPEMTPLPAGKFLMGSPEDEPGHLAYEGPRHDVAVPAFAIATTEVTFDQWSACVEDGGCNGFTPSDRGFGRGARPVIGVNWHDARAYAAWLSRETGETYRLPTEAEWEYAARGGTIDAYWWGPRFERARAPRGETIEAGSGEPNPFGLHEMLGNAREWVEDCYVNNYNETPVDGSAEKNGDCSRRVVRGGSYRSDPADIRSANRGRITADIRDGAMGFRVARDLSE